ncbi:MAG: hypothetical protein QOJ86_445 [Bradyrhizobium sp.]|jgi:hypothetical protein|nr:hypothetical protein [Bradyrhizobium sp.]
MPNFMLLATAWGPKHGGINAFNMDFAIGLANHLGEKAKVFCAVFMPSAEDVADARGKNVNLVAIDRPVQSAAYDPSWAHDVWKMFSQCYPNEQIDWWIGHDVTTGWAAVEGPIVAAHGQSALIMHMNYADYQNYKGGVGQQAQAKENQQRQLFKKGSRNFANGPLLRDALRDIVGPEVTMLVPGFAAVPIQPSSHRLHLITFGRMDRESARIKQGALAVAGFASAVKQSSLIPGSPEKLQENPQMRVVGIKESDGGEEQTLTRLAADKAGREVNLIALPFDESRNDLLDELGRANIALMLSWHEGFGLTGWEAVAGEVPLIISKQTGLWQLLKETFGERPAAGYVRTIDVRGRRGDDDVSNFLPEDEVAVRDSIIECAAHLPMARNDATKLKQELKSKLICTWDHTARQFCDGLDMDAIKSPAIVRPGPERPSRKLIVPSIQQSNFLTIPKLEWPKDLSDKGFEMPDSMLLRPESQVIRFHHFREPLRDAIIEWVLERDAPIKLRLLAGEGGAGKTRLLIEVCYRLEALYGWRAGFVASAQSALDQFPKLLREGKPCLLVLDYAESRTAEIIEITRTALYSGAIPDIRVALLAREGGDWWDRLADAAGSDQAVAAVLRGLLTKTGPYRMGQESIRQEDRGTIFNQAREDFATFKKISAPLAITPDLSADLFRNLLFLHLAALGSLRNQNSLDDKDLLGMALGHERSYWRKLLKDVNLSEQVLPALEQVVAMLTLCGGKRSAKEAKAVLARTPRARELETSARIALFDILRQLYPHPIEGGLISLQPDLLGETLVSEALTKDDELLDAIFDEGIDHADIRYALTVLTRLARRAPTEQKWLKVALERHLAKVSEDALYVGIETGSPMPEIYAETIRAAEPRIRRHTVDLLRVKMPKETVNLASLTTEVRSQIVEFLKKKTTGKGAKRDIALFDAYLALSSTLKESGNFSESLDAALQAVECAETAFVSDSASDKQRRAFALEILASSFRAIGRFKEAVEKAQSAESILRELAVGKANDYEIAWLSSLLNFSGLLISVGRFDDALRYAEEAETIWRKIAEKTPAHRDRWAGSITIHGAALRNLGRSDEALRIAAKAAVVLEQLAKEDPEKHLVHWANSLGNLSANFSDAGNFDEALLKSEHAEAILRDLYEKQPDTYASDWSIALSHLSIGLGSFHRYEDALEKAALAEELLRRLIEKRPLLLEDWSRSLANLAEAQLNAGRPAMALDMAAKAILNIRPLFESYPLVHGLWLGFAYRISADSNFQLKNFDQANVEAEQSTRLWVQGTALRPNFESVQAAKAFRALMRSEKALGKTKSVFETLGSAFNLLRKPLNDNPKPLRPVMSELVDLALSVDAERVRHVIPAELLTAVRGVS